MPTRNGAQPPRPESSGDEKDDEAPREREDGEGDEDDLDRTMTRKSERGSVAAAVAAEPLSVVAAATDGGSGMVKRTLVPLVADAEFDGSTSSEAPRQRVIETSAARAVAPSPPLVLVSLPPSKEDEWRPEC